jgi:TrmH family RNA methyltransferase
MAMIPAKPAAPAPNPVFVRSKDNPLLVQLRRLTRDGTAYRRLGQVWLEGDHLCAALLARGLRPQQALITEASWADARLRQIAQAAPRIAVVPEALFKGISALESAANLGFLWSLQAEGSFSTDARSVVLDRLQDAGNVGSILRSAAALGVQQVLALKGSVALWSPKVLRAGMGAHFALALFEGLEEGDLHALNVSLVGTSSHAGVLLPQVKLPDPCAWVLGHEGQGVSSTLAQRCALVVRIPQPGGEESLNVAAAAAVCLYESARQALPG